MMAPVRKCGKTLTISDTLHLKCKKIEEGTNCGMILRDLRDMVKVRC